VVFAGRTGVAECLLHGKGALGGRLARGAPTHGCEEAKSDYRRVLGGWKKSEGLSNDDGTKRGHPSRHRRRPDTGVMSGGR